MDPIHVSDEMRAIHPFQLGESCFSAFERFPQSLTLEFEISPPVPMPHRD
jgi:hypothetical protein